MPQGDTPAIEGELQHRRSWVAWLVAISALAVVVLVATHVAEERQFVEMLESAQPTWIVVGMALQACTYLCQALIWRLVLARYGDVRPLSLLYRLSLAQLFIDQAIPSGAASGSIFIAKSFSNRGVERSTVSGAILVSALSYYTAYVLALVASLAVFKSVGRLSSEVGGVSSLFIGLAAVICVSLYVLARRGFPQTLPFVSRFELGRRMLDVLGGADGRLAMAPKVMALAVILQVTIFVLDAASLWACLAAVGSAIAPIKVFAAFVLASLARTMGIVPGGLGTFEAVSIGTLVYLGVPVSSALAATILLRGYSFWLPMAPGMIFAQREARLHSIGKTWQSIDTYWGESLAGLQRTLQTTLNGLTDGEAARRLASLSRSELSGEASHPVMRILWNQVKSPLVLILLGAALVAGLTEDWPDTVLVVLILAGSTIVGFWREYGATAALEELRARISIKARVVRGGVPQDVLVAAVVPGDVVLLGAGCLVPGDGVVLEANGLFLDQAIITGESFPVEKRASATGVAHGTPLQERDDCLFFGTSVRSGEGRALIVKTGSDTTFGTIAQHLTLSAPETEFDRGLRKLGNLLLLVMLIMIVTVFAGSTLMERATTESLMFAVALAVGLSPELLPAILTINLAKSSRTLARHGVLVRHRNAIENLGSMDVICTDKTGTITKGAVELEGALDLEGRPSTSVLALAVVNARYQGGLPNPLDEAIRRQTTEAAGGVEKIGEIPYDFVRKRLSVVVRDQSRAKLICKGALEQVIAVCRFVDGKSSFDEGDRASIRQRFQQLSDRGIRVLGIATRDLPIKDAYDARDEKDLVFRGFLTFSDQPKRGIAEVLSELRGLGIVVKIISGDNRLVTRSVAEKVGMKVSSVMTGEELDDLRDEALWKVIDDVDVFAQVDPNQKERIILALKKRNHVVGYMGDGVNDAPAMHAADASISVETAADIAKSTADIVLLDKDLAIIARGVREGRRTFANTLKYVLLTTSANLGNMISMAIASFFLPFLPMLAGQILLNNFLSDLPAVGLANDDVDPELVESPRRWDVGFIRKYMVEFGLISSVFDFLTFGLLLWILKASVDTFRTAWFVESLLTELAVVFVLRTRRRFDRSAPGRMLLFTSIGVAMMALAVPYAPLSERIGFVPLPGSVVAAIILLTGLYIFATEVAKHSFYRRIRTSELRGEARSRFYFLSHPKTRI
jgi:Mg2+-importing ATPase